MPVFFLVSFWLAMLTGCAGTPSYNETSLKDKILDVYSDWKGTPYKYNSISKEGIDCSGLMYVTFKSEFDIQLPRSTDKLLRTGKQVPRSDLKAGDLVFFKTARKDHHVGVYLGDNRFMHASTSVGVTISDLSNQYWKDTYLTSRRIFG